MAGGRVLYLLGTGPQLPFASGSVDLVVANHVFEHVEDPEQVAREVNRVLKPTGLLFASVPDGFSFSDGLYRWCTGGGGHIQRYTFREFQRTIEAGTDLALLFACPLYTSFTYLNATPQAAKHLARRYQSLARLPRVVREGMLRGMNRVSRAADALLRTQLSLYGWAFYFGKPGATIKALPEELFINVCAFCGCGHSGTWLLRRQQHAEQLEALAPRR
jgi:SAM-dependent methyltransferase